MPCVQLLAYYVFDDEIIDKGFLHLLDKAFAHALVARSGSIIESKILNMTRKSSTVKSCWVSKTFVATL